MMLKQEACAACRADAPQVSAVEAEQLMQQIPDWAIEQQSGVSVLVREYKFDDFQQAMIFSNLIANMAESEQHHPDILTSWGKVRLCWYTHKINGLHRNDFICAARSDQLYK